MITSPSRGAHGVPARAARGRQRGRHALPRARRTGLGAVLLSLAVVPVLAGAGTVAHAFWTSSGYGQAQVGAATALDLVVTGVATTEDALHPGSTSDLRLSLANPNPYDVRLTTLTGATVTSSLEGSCPGGTHLVLPADVSDGDVALVTPILVPAGSTGTPAVLAGLVTLSTSAPDACQGVTFTVALAFRGSQA